MVRMSSRSKGGALTLTAPAVRVKAHQYLQGWGPWPAAGQRERRCPWPRQPCPPGPGDGPAMEGNYKQRQGCASIYTIISSQQTCCVPVRTRAPLLGQFAQWRRPGFHRGSTWRLPQPVPRVCEWPPACSCPGCYMSSGQRDSGMEEMQHGVSITHLRQSHACSWYLRSRQILSKEPLLFLKKKKKKKRKQVFDRMQVNLLRGCIWLFSFSSTLHLILQQICVY